MSTQSIRWLHVSDFHMGKDELGQERLTKYVLEFLKQKIEKGESPDFVFITGDLANKGKLAEYNLFFNQFLFPLDECLGGLGNVFVVPGNHDVDQSQGSQPDWYTILTREPHLLDDDEKGLDKRKENLLKRFETFAINDITFLQKPHWLLSTKGYFAVRVPKGGFTVGILGINTAWLSQGDKEKN